MAGPKSHKGRREKGARGEREFFALLNKYLPESMRMQRELSQTRDAGLDGISASVGIEVKRQETLSIPKWLRQAREGAKDKVPVVAYRQSGDEWHCLVDLTPMQLAAFMRAFPAIDGEISVLVGSEAAAESLPK